MKILGIETSCDETSAAVVEDGKTVLSNIVASQDELHRKFGGVIPEIASRAHIKALLPVVQEALEQSSVQRHEIDAVAVTNKPGLIGSLLIGLTFAKSFSLAADIPLLGINHLEGHGYAALLEHEVVFPAVTLIISGGHTVIFHSKDILSYELIGSTIDDAAGEAFDKVARILKLGYPGGPVIDRMAKQGNEKRFRFPRTFIKNDDFRFSFSGIKTAVMYHCQGHSSGKTDIRDMDEQEVKDTAASFQEAVIDVLIAKANKAAREKNVDTLIIGGGVACNSRLRERMNGECPCKVIFPSKKYCIDNGAMIAGIAFHKLKNGHRDDLLLEAHAQSVRM